MGDRFSIAGTAALAAAYFAAASATIVVARFDEGIASLWFATAILVAALSRIPRRNWARPVAACGIASGLATSLFGLGVESAAPMAVVNLGEAVVIAFILRHGLRAARPLESIAGVLHFVAAAGIAGPVVGGVLCAAWFAVTGLGETTPVETGLRFFIGHSLGNLVLTPLAMLFLSARSRSAMLRRFAARPAESFLLILASTLISIVALAQPLLPLLFIPVLPIMLICFRLGREGAAISLVILTIVGGLLTGAGHGPVGLPTDDPQQRALFFHFYLACTVLTVLPVAAELTRRRRVLRSIRESEEGYRIIAEYSTDIIFKLDLDGRVRFVTPSVRQLGYSPEQLVGRNCACFIDPEDLAAAATAHNRTAAMPGSTNRFEYRAIAADGSRHWLESHARVVVDEDGVADGMVSIVRNIADRKTTEQRLLLAALTDVLTDLPNRRAFVETVGARIAEGRTADSLALLDIDHFKRVNDRYGHDGGDEVLRAFAEAARRVIRPGDYVARTGGEEFAILFPDTSVEKSLLICERLRAELAGAIIFVGDLPVRVTVSGGVAAIGPDGLDTALKVADLALYRAKEAGRDRLAIAA